MSEKIIIKAPATSANVGPGFDVFAFALDMYNEIVFEKIDSGLEIEGCPDEFRNEKNLVFRAYKSVFDVIGKEVGGLKFTEKSKIPFCRGLGSSAAMIAGGAIGANEMLNSPLSKKELLEICLKIEPHPDNLAASIYGGFTSAVTVGEEHIIKNTKVNDKLNFYAVITEQKVETEKSRLVLPDMIALKDAVFNISRASMLQDAFESGDKELLPKLLHDKIHEPYRKDLIDDYDEVRAIALSEGAYAFYISGSGSTCIAMSNEEDFIEKMNRRLEKSKIKREIVKLKASNEGAKRV